ncbi:DUF2249 domain-containing protein [Botryobacter ruber]|uniref:DUF2249 domain-containing protein n=1 Tax=Botryobacter ruber TaxID=2171629 RepID=UPI000E0AAEEC|nr:DUF2249 domain-containing protein [Botryobacter ruber]
MNIAATTKISALIKANPDAIEAIASINRRFEKLRNPVLRKVLASRVTIADAARIGGCAVEDFYEKLAPLGFNSGNTTEPNTMQTTETKIALPAFLSQLDEAQVLTLDVCEDIATGNDPFLKIMAAVEQLDGSNALLIINTFEPTPLISILAKRGYNYYTVVKSEDLVHTYFWLQTAVGAAAVVTAAAELSFDEALQTYGQNIRKIDVRHLEMPQPMVTILNELEQLPPEEALYVTHRRVPQFLLPQLQERGFSIKAKEAGPAEVYLLIYKET